MVFSKYQYVSKRYTERTVPYNLAKEYMQTLEFTRRPDFYKAWPEWKELVSRFYSFNTGFFLDVLLSGSAPLHPFVYDSRSNDMAVGKASIFSSAKKFWDKFPKLVCKTILSEIKHSNRLYYPGDFDIILDDRRCDCTRNVFEAYFYSDMENLTGVEQFNPFPYSECPLKHWHMRNIYIPLILSLLKRSKRSLKKYYISLIRFLYIVDEDRVNWDDIEKLIFEPPIVRPRNIMIYIYNHHYCEKFSEKVLNDILYFFEREKHNLVQQSCTSQSVSASLFHELALIYKEIYNFSPQQQVGVKMTHEFSEIQREALFARFEQSLEKAQNDFMSAMRDSLTEISHYALTLFIIVAAIALLGYSMVRLGEKIIFGTLNLLYRMLFKTTEEAEVVQQGEEGVSIPFLPAMIVKNVIQPPTSIASNLWNNPQVDKAMRRIGYLGDPKIHRGVTYIADWMKQMINQVMNWFSREILGVENPEDIVNVCSPVEKWFDECDEFMKSYWAGTMQWNDSTWSVLMNLYGKGTGLARQKVFDAFKNDVYKVLFKLANILEKFNSRGRSGNSVRNPPVTIYMSGGTGVGKSSVTYPLAAEILKGIFQKEQSNIDLKKCWKSLIYMRSSEQEYWDGYENQLVTVFDDFNQMVDSAGNPNVELFEVIRASNSFPYPLHMASLDQKATTTFSSKIILVSSNLEQPKSVSLNFPEALWRRFDLSIKVTRKPGAVVVPGKFDPNIYNFQRYDMSTQSCGEFMSYKEVVFYAVTEYFRRKGFVDSVDSYITDVLSDVPDPSPVQQGVGTALGNTVCFVKQGVKESLNYVTKNYYDFKDVVTGTFCSEEMSTLQTVLNKIKGKMSEIKQHWINFKEKHPYMVKALQFIGLAALVFAVVKLFLSFTQKEEKPKIMSMEQFIKEGEKPKEILTATDVKRVVRNLNKQITAESYTQINQKPLKTEGYNIVEQKPLRVESYTDVKAKQLRAEGAVFNVLCPHELASDNKYLFQRNLLKACDETCPNMLLAEGVKDVNASEILGKVVQFNFYKLYMSHNDEAIGHGFFLRGRVFMCPKHYLAVFKKLADVEGKIYFKSAFLNRSFEIYASEIVDNYKAYESPEDGKDTISRDIMAFPVGSAVTHANIEPLFASKQNLSYVLRSQVVLPVIMENTKKNPLPFIGFHFTTGTSGLTVRHNATIKDDKGTDMRQMRDLWEYSMDTRSTFCGAPLVVRNTQIMPGKIIGMHVAGIANSGLGFSTPVYKEDIERIISMFKSYDTVEFRQETKLDPFPVEQGQVPSDAEFIRLGSVPRMVSQPGKSKIIPSPIYNKIREPKTRPCLLRPAMVNGELFDPRAYRLGRLGNFPVALDQKLLANAKKAVIDEMATQISRVELGVNIKSVYDFEEAVVGIDGEPYINSVKRNTSPGYPFVHMPGFSNRKEIFGDDEKCDMDRPQAKILQRRVQKIIDLAKENIALDHIFMDTLKDERKPIHKAHKTRLFSAGPIDYLIASKMYFNGIVAVLQKSRNLCHISVGTDPNTMDWSTIVKELQRKSEEMVAGDFEGFDASQCMPLLVVAGEVLIELSKMFCGTTEEEAHVMRVLLIGLYNSTHITEHEVFRWTHSLPSGHYLTAIINSIFVNLVFCVVWMLAHRQKELQALSGLQNSTLYCRSRYIGSYLLARSFFKKCGIVAFGDDHIVSVPIYAIPYFNQQLLPGLMREIGLGYTMEDKDREVDVLTRRITEISYLKRSFVFNEDYQRWMGPLSLDTILESPMWLHKCPDKVTQMVTQLDAQMRELSLHDSETWDKWSSVFADLGKQYGHYTVYVNQEETRAEVLLE